MAQQTQLSVRAVSFFQTSRRGSVSDAPSFCVVADFEAQPHPRVPRRCLPPRHVHGGRQHAGGELEKRERSNARLRVVRMEPQRRFSLLTLFFGDRPKMTVLYTRIYHHGFLDVMEVVGWTTAVF